DSAALDDPCTRNSTGLPSPGAGAPIRLRNICSDTSPFLAVYSAVQNSPPAWAAAGVWAVAPDRSPVARPAPAALITSRRAMEMSEVIGSSRLYRRDPRRWN